MPWYAAFVTRKRRDTMNNLIITIARQSGSGGREIGERVAEILQIKTYGRELINMAAKDTDISEQALEKADETAANSLLYTLAMGSNIFGAGHLGSYNLPINDKLFILQSDVIREIAQKESAVIIGRCADFVLRKHEKRLSVFIYADIEKRRERVIKRHPELKASEVIESINKTDKRRSSYYNFYTGSKWGKYDNYHLALDSGKLGVEGCAQIIAQCARMLNEENK